MTGQELSGQEGDQQTEEKGEEVLHKALAPVSQNDNPRHIVSYEGGGKSGGGRRNFFEFSKPPPLLMF